MTKIVASSESLTRLSNDLGTEKDNITSCISKLDTELEQINNSWEGADATKYIAKMKEDYSSLLNDYNSCLDSYADYLGQVFSEYEKVDTKYQGMKIEV